MSNSGLIALRVNMTILIELDDLLKGLDDAADKNGIWKAMSGFLSIRDVKAYIYHNLPTLGASDYNHSYIYQENLYASLGQSCMLRNSNFERLLRENARTLTSSKYWKDWDIFNTENQAVTNSSDDSHAFEPMNGISIPVHGPQGRDGCFSLEFTNTISGMRNIDNQMLQWSCQYAHQSFCRLLTADQLEIPKLTARETQILTWIALGKSNAEIATILGISFHTVGTYTRRIFDKTKTNNRTSAALCGISNGLITV